MLTYLLIASVSALAGVAGTGQTATGSVAQAGQNYADNASANLIGAGNARASSYLAQGNALGNSINQGIATIGRSYNPPTNYNNWTGGFMGLGQNGLGTTGPIGGTGGDVWYG